MDDWSNVNVESIIGITVSNSISPFYDILTCIMRMDHVTKTKGPPEI